jgi:hypothetical protein
VFVGALKNHIQRKVKPEDRGLMVWRFAQDNLSRVAALMVYSNLVVEGIKRLKNHPDRCLLRTLPKGKFEILVGEKGEPLLESEREIGAYVVWDKEELVWIRSGKGRFYKRWEEHRNCARLVSPASRKSKFYTCYPSKQAVGAEKFRSCRLGWFEELAFCTFISYNRKSNGTKHLYDMTGNGIFVWSDEVRNSIDKRDSSAKRREAQDNLASYLLEMAAELAISPVNNVSESVGFEAYTLRNST